MRDKNSSHEITQLLLATQDLIQALVSSMHSDHPSTCEDELLEVELRIEEFRQSRKVTAEVA